MQFQKLSLLLLLSSVPALFAMEEQNFQDLSVSTMRHTAAQIQAETNAKLAALQQQIKQKQKENKRTFAWTRGKIESKLNARDTQKALAMYEKSIATIEQDGLSQSKKYVTETVVPQIPNGNKERLLYNKKFVEKEIAILNTKLETINKDLSATSTGWFSWFTK